MRTLCGLFGATVVSGLGWWLGDFLGLGTAVILSGIGGGVGLYYGRKLFTHYLG